MEKRKLPQIGAGSMADVAFLLLVFFLVATTIQTDTGLNVMLPPWSEDMPSTPRNNRNVLSVIINSQNQLMVEKQETKVSDLKKMTEHFILHEADSPKKAIVSLQNDNSTSYETYITVYNEIKAGYNQIWEDEAQRKFGQRYKDLKKEAQRSIRKDFPLVISEAEPSDIAANQ